ncbi:MAG TPA: DivIVA domain-containing protein [Acidimicrobiales bacterium]|nr:DivIVA domain-containing protein [Acidimicrobiales bacterium]
MEISGRVLREVEFRDRLRGYDTEEVDEFLERVAVAIDSLIAELEQARAASHGASPADDDSLARTLILAQRTADLAIKEAREEASSLVEEARTQADALLGSAQSEAKRLREGAEADAQTKIAELEDRRIELEGAVDSLSAFVEAERRKLLDGLRTALEVVGEALKPAGNTPTEMSEGAGPQGSRAPDEVDGRGRDDSGPPTRPVETMDRGRDREEEASAFDDNGSKESTQQSLDGPAASRDEVSDLSVSDALAITDDAALAEVESIVDPDEELWQRWAKGADLDVVPETKSRAVRTSARTERRGRGSV